MSPNDENMPPVTVYMPISQAVQPRIVLQHRVSRVRDNQEERQRAAETLLLFASGKSLEDVATQVLTQWEVAKKREKAFLAAEALVDLTAGTPKVQGPGPASNSKRGRQNGQVFTSGRLVGVQRAH